MTDWRKKLEYDPLPYLLSSDIEAVKYFAKRDLLGEEVGSIKKLWELPEAKNLFKKQLADGSWPRAGEQKHSAINYSLIETWKYFRLLVEKFEFTRDHPPTEKSAEFLFSCQTPEGDIRGMLANQYATYYTGAIMALLIKAGYADDPRIKKGFDWLLYMRQDDHGWTIPLVTHKFDRETQYRLTSEYEKPVEPDRTKPFSHNWTGMVLRAFAAHKEYRKTEAALTGSNLILSRIFQKDCYSSYQAASYWIRFEYPFWWNNLVAALDSISLIGVTKEEEKINQALIWFVNHQESNGLWRVSYNKDQDKDTAKIREMKLWVTLAICRIFKRLSV
ncbi:MAG: hypothetical protein MUO54_03295 [Anaerolineales bacterium]|nr:hypothetical protein [Anaerolineales bacterium]